MPGADPRALLDAAFAELDAAVEALTKLVQAGEPDRTAGEALPASLSAERSLLRAVFQHAPAPLLLLEPDGTIRRANGKAGDLIGAPPGYATGKPLTAFVDLASRAAVQSQLAAAARTGTARQADCTLLGPAGPVAATLTTNVIDPARTALRCSWSQSDGPRGLRRRPVAGGTGGVVPRRETIQSMTRRMDMITAVTRLLLDNSTFSEAVTLQRCARLLAGDIASWVIVDVERSGQLRRQFVIGPPANDRTNWPGRCAPSTRSPTRWPPRSIPRAGPWSSRTRTTPGFSALPPTGRRC